MRIVLLALFAVGCGSPRHLQYDHGRAFTATMTAQADLTRPSAATTAHPLGGLEAAAIRLRATEAATEEKTAESELESGAME